MKQFFKFMFASMVGFLLVQFIIGMVFMLIMISAATFSISGSKTEIGMNSVLRLSLDKPIYDRAPSNPFEGFNFGDLESLNNPGLDDILKGIKKAAEDENIKGIYLDLSYIPSGIATIDEIRNALIGFKKSGKFIIAYGDAFSQTAYYIASVADKVYMHPQGMLMFQGLSAQLMFFKGTLEKLDVQAQVIRHGKYKSAIEPFIMDKMSEASREQTEKFIFAIWDQIVKGISESRKISIEELNGIADSLLVQSAADALKYKLIDGVMYKDEILDELKTKLEIEQKDKISFVNLNKYKKVKVQSKDSKYKKDKIAVVYAIGGIQEGNGDDRTIGADRISEAIREARTDSSVKAIVLRVNSPGGSALASDIIWREVYLANEVKPVVVSMGDVAASGGYYIACAATKIYASPNTITGSIGVFGLVPNLQNFFKNKLGITFDAVKTNECSDFLTTNRAMTTYETAVLQNDIENIYQTFIQHVADGRKMTTAQVDSIGQGRVWSGTDAKDIGLIDEFGGLEAAVAGAADLAGIENYKIVNYPRQKDPFTQIMEQLNGDTKISVLKGELGENYVYYEYLQNMSRMSGVQARLPFDVIIR